MARGISPGVIKEAIQKLGADLTDEVIDTFKGAANALPNPRKAFNQMVDDFGGIKYGDGWTARDVSPYSSAPMYNGDQNFILRRLKPEEVEVIPPSPFAAPVPYSSGNVPAPYVSRGPNFSFGGNGMPTPNGRPPLKTKTINNTDGTYSWRKQNLPAVVSRDYTNEAGDIYEKAKDYMNNQGYNYDGSKMSWKEKMKYAKQKSKRARQERAENKAEAKVQKAQSKIDSMKEDAFRYANGEIDIDGVPLKSSLGEDIDGIPDWAKTAGLVAAGVVVGGAIFDDDYE